MASINQLIRKAINPFAPETFKPGNFWHEAQDPKLHVPSIHQQVLTEIETLLDRVAADRQTRTLMLYGDSGSGKSHLLGRLKTLLNPKAFFVYIDPFPDSEFIWRHILRSTVDSLVQVPAGGQESQLLRWLQSLSAFQSGTLVDWVLGERKAFVRKLRATYPTGVYNASQFFGVLYDLLNPDLRPLACDWLRGDDLDEADLKALRVTRAIETENAAQKVLANFGRIAVETQPLVLCFDQLDNIARLPDGAIDLQALFSVNSSLHNQNLKNFLVIISIITNTWKQNLNRIQPADRARLDAGIPLKPIDLDQAEALWSSRLAPFYRRANPKPPSAIAPLTRDILEQKFPGGKTNPRNVLELGRRLIQNYKVGGKLASEDPLAAFKLVWLKEWDKTQKRVSRLRQFAAPELIQMLREALVALGMEAVRSRFLPSPTYATHSLSYQHPDCRDRIGVVWSEDPNMTTFYHIMNACRRVVELELCHTLQLIRLESIGQPKRKGHKLYQKIFTRSPHQHLKPTLAAVHTLATYHSLVNAACSGELVVAGKTPDPQELATLIRNSQVLHACPLLQDLGIVPVQSRPKTQKRPQLQVNLHAVEEFLLNLVKTQQVMGLQTLIQGTMNQFPEANETQIVQQIEQLCQHKQMQLLDPQAKPEEQVICLVP